MPNGGTLAVAMARPPFYSESKQLNGGGDDPRGGYQAARRVCRPSQSRNARAMVLLALVTIFDKRMPTERLQSKVLPYSSRRQRDHNLESEDKCTGAV